MNFKTLGILMFIVAESLHAQTEFRFEVASIRRSAGGEDKSIRPSGDSILMRGMTLNDLVSLAYQVQDFQVSGGADWAKSDRYDIAAKAASKASWSQMMVPMLQDLLKERFNLRLHPETKELPVYSLVVAKSGLKAQPSKKACTVVNESSPQFKPGEPAPVFCGALRASRGGLNGIYVGSADLARTLSFALSRTVVDKTGIDRRFDVHLSFTPIDATYSPVPALGNDTTVKASAVIDGEPPSIFTAIQQELGLRLEPSRGPVNVLVIDSAEKPGEN